MQSRIIISQNLSARQAKLNQELAALTLTPTHPDVLILGDETKLGIAQSREIQSFLSLKPYSAQGRVVIVESAHNFTPDAQNALLKTLEEPPPNATILLGAANPNSFLPTVLSRCELVFLSGEEGRGEKPIDITKFISLDVPQKFTAIEKTTDKKAFLQQLIVHYRKQFHQNPQDYKKMQVLLEAEEWSNSNVNTRAILEYLVTALTPATV